MVESTREPIQIGTWKFFVSIPQRVLLSFVLIILVLLGISSRDASRSALQQSEVLTAVENPATSIIFTQRETLAYATRLAQWSGGSIPRRDVQVARALLAQRLQVVDSTGTSVGQTASKDYWTAVKNADNLLQSTTPGLLPPAHQAEVKKKLAPILDSLLFQGRALVFTYESAVDAELKKIAAANGNKDARTLRLLDSFVILLFTFLLWIGFSNYRLYQDSLKRLVNEQERIEGLLSELARSESEVQELRTLNDQKNAFISTVNHELRTPMTSIIGYTEVLHDMMDAENNDAVHKSLHVITRNADIMLNLIESMLSISRLEAHGEEVELEDVDVDAVMQDSLFVLQPNLQKANVAIELADLDNQPHRITGNSSQLSQVFFNLVGNAIKFSPPGSKIVLRIMNYLIEESSDGESTSGGVEIHIEDNGIGIPEADQSRVFTRFFRAKNAVSNQYSGTGLGLAIVGRVIELHNGTISLQSKEGKGTLFVVRFPKGNVEAN